MVPTPKLSHLTRGDLRLVYEPAEDTFILLDALEQAFPPELWSKSDPKPESSSGQAYLQNSNADSRIPIPSEVQCEDVRQRKKPRLCVEIGSGSGCVSTFVAQLLGNSEAAFICTDINPHAAICTARTGVANSVHLEPINGSLLSPLLSRVRGQVDLLIFNPPYVPTEAEEEAHAQLEAQRQKLKSQRQGEENQAENKREEPKVGGLDAAAAWAGGETGTRLLKELIHGGGPTVEKADVQTAEESTQGIETILAPGGSFFLVAIKQNDPPGIVKDLQSRGLQSEIVLSRRAGREHLFVIRGYKTWR